VLDYPTTKGEIVPDRGLPELPVLELLFVVCGYLAHRKGRNTAGWTVLGFLFSLIALVVVVLLPTARRSHPAGAA